MLPRGAWGPVSQLVTHHLPRLKASVGLPMVCVLSTNNSGTCTHCCALESEDGAPDLLLASTEWTLKKENPLTSPATSEKDVHELITPSLNHYYKTPPCSLQVKTHRLFWFVCLIYIFWSHHTACGIVVLQPGIEPVPPAWVAQSLNHRTTRKSEGHNFEGMSLLWPSLPGNCDEMGSRDDKETHP